MSTNLLFAIIGLAIGAVVGMYVMNFIKAPTEQKLAIVRHWLIYAVAIAEKDLGSGTGKLKLLQVYNDFVTQFPKLAEVILFDQFSTMVDEALVEFRKMLENKSIDAIITGKEDEQ